MGKRIVRSLGFVIANVVVMIILHGNSRQFWPKIPYLSLRNESTAEHTRLLFNTMMVVTIGQALIGQLPRERWLPRGIVLAVLPALLPALIFLGRRVLRLQGDAGERYNLSLVPLLPIAASVLEEILTAKLNPPADEPHADYSHLV
ncbi:hypothetical protein QTO31_14645 [Chloroflexus sp. MS-CIW-1]|jgi:NhaP-type Na+/H+ or K+/H+ antiporter|uniref:hypothetical protein n=1 Tax=unclassified Chloroflexus TaxID=2633855 RepID=UPI0004DEEC6D|nr:MULTISPECIES: hypothetical protein [unclassified Chloroflexus]MBO9347148.1 hypothetical protein [Chloroflexus sp.]MDN5273206.1 hypothetical protein [Chloroflexus sp. MS-CIW-1]